MHIVGISIKDEIRFIDLGEFHKHQLIAYALHLDWEEVIANLGPKGDTLGFSFKFLVEKALAFKSKENWVTINVVLSLMIFCS